MEILSRFKRKKQSTKPKLVDLNHPKNSAKARRFRNFEAWTKRKCDKGCGICKRCCEQLQKIIEDTD